MISFHLGCCLVGTGELAALRADRDGVRSASPREETAVDPLREEALELDELCGLNMV